MPLKVKAGLAEHVEIRADAARWHEVCAVHHEQRAAQGIPQALAFLGV